MMASAATPTLNIAETIKFRDICVMLEKVKKAANVVAKEKYLRRYYESFQKHRLSFREQIYSELAVPPEEEKGGSSFYSILRCLIPGADSARSAYGLQINSLGKVYIKILQLPMDSRDAARLQARSYTGGSHGDYADSVYIVLRTRCKKEPSNLTLQQVHDMLDTIAADDRKNTEKVLTRLSEVASANEQMWFIRLLLKSMTLGISQERIFSIMHPEAKTLYLRCSDLQRVCRLLADNRLEDSLSQAIEPFQHIRPQLCEIFPGNIEPLMAADVLYMETKMDGERFQLHYLDGRFKYISRNGIDYTYSFGESAENGKLSPLLAPLLPIGLQSMILDGEMMVWDPDLSKFCPKGENTDVKHLNERRSWRPCFVVYDLLYLNGSIMLDMPYVQRTHKLREIIRETPGVLQTMKPTKVSSVEEFKSMFQQALNANEEGVVLKKQNALYRPGVRNGGGWYKAKADYIAGLTTEFDLLIIGGFYNRTKSFIESFLLGVLDFQSPQEFAVYSVAKVSNIIRQRVVLNAALKPHWHSLSNEPAPIWYHYVASSAEGRPDVWIEPCKSQILQIKAADLTISGQFALSKCLHFPRVEAWRNDKLWHECVSLQDFKQMSSGNKGIQKLNKRDLSLNDVTTDRQKKLTVAQKRKIGMEAYENRFDAKQVRKSSDIFSGFSFCIISASLKNGYTPEQLKAMVVENGGELVENPIVQDPKCICIAGDITLRTELLMKGRKYNIGSMRWLVKMCENQQMQLHPKNMICMTDDLKLQFSALYDKHGDSYTEYVDVNTLKEIMDDIPDEELDAMEWSDSVVLSLEAELYNKQSPNFFRQCHGHFYSTEQQRTQLANMLFKWRGGSIIDLTSNTAQLQSSYIFINAEHIDKLNFKKWLVQTFKNNLKNVQVVHIDWIVQSHHSKRQLDIFEYTWHDF